MKEKPSQKQQFIRLISQQRFQRYLDETDGDYRKALDLYSWNAQISGAFLTPIHHLEITLRNHINEALAAKYKTASWFINNPDLLASTIKQARKVERNLKRGKNRKKKIEPEKVVAELPFGYWTKLLSKRYEHTLWIPAISKNLPPNTDRATTIRRLDNLNKFRNRIAHHEPIYQLNLKNRYGQILGLIQTINPQFAKWVHQNNQVNELLKVKST